ncbi:cysteine-rich venom protein latisemin [Magallana gigas]|uniref:cysteine-rich venom protein latisemin n=1 Tax=Magallana gigas TaxID=29159 RepID=UPI00333EB199
MGRAILLISISFYVANAANLFDFIKNEADTDISNILIDRNFAGVSKRHSPHNGRQKRNSEMQLDLNNLSIRGEEEPKTSTSVPEMAAMPNDFANRRTMRSLNSEQEQEVVDAHNAARLRASSSNMMKMRYNKVLAAQAQAHADSCVEAHSGLASENMFFSSANTINMSQAVHNWEIEKYDYDYDTNTCKEGRACGHYTQVVWASSDEVGCGASNKCGGDYKTHIVCQYLPSGNYAGVRPFKTGAPCSDCTACGHSCENGLCTRETSQCTDCYTGTGESYEGKYNTTLSGIPCQNWKSKFDFLDDHNYCRNMFSSSGFTKPLCYVSPTPGNYVVEYCNVPMCGQ